MRGPNELLPCGTESARQRHAAHGETCAVCDNTANKPTPVLCHQCGSADRPGVLAFIQQLEQTIADLKTDWDVADERISDLQACNAERAAEVAATKKALREKTNQLASARREIKRLLRQLAVADEAFEALLRTPVIRHEAVERARRFITEAHPPTHKGVAA